MLNAAICVAFAMIMEGKCSEANLIFVIRGIEGIIILFPAESSEVVEPYDEMGVFISIEISAFLITISIANATGSLAG